MLVQKHPCLELVYKTIGIYRFRVFVNAHVETLSPAPGQFYRHRDQIRYMNGRNGVYETNILYPENVLFLPDGQQRSGFKWEPVLFRKMHKVEWLFE